MNPTDLHHACGRAPKEAPVLWLSLPDEPEDQDAPLLAALKNGGAWTDDMHQAARLARMGYTVKRRDRHLDGHLVETSLTAEVLDLSIERGVEIRGAREFNRPPIRRRNAEYPERIEKTRREDAGWQRADEAEAKLEELREAVRNFRDVSGRYHTEIACKRLFALLPENSKLLNAEF